MCKSCHRQFTDDQALSYKDCLSSGTIRRTLLMPVRGIGIRDVSEIESISIRKGSVLVRSSYVLKPQQTHDVSLEVDEFWTCVQKKSGIGKFT